MRAQPSSRTTRLVRTLATLFTLGLAVAPRLVAQSSTGVIEGVARAAAGEAPIAFALVRLLHADSLAVTPRQGITSADGRFRFAGVASGSYRLQLLRIGFRPVVSSVLQLPAGGTLRHVLHGAVQATQLPAVTVHAPGTCLAGDRLAADPHLATLWAEARRGVEIRRAFELRYRFTRLWHKHYEARLALRPDQRWTEVDTLLMEPDSVIPREQQRRARAQAEGYGQENAVRIPDERELLEDDFLRDHCVEPPIDVADDGSLGLRFRPLQARSGGHGLRGTIRVDPTTYLIQRLDLEHLDGTTPVTRTRMDYADVTVGGSTLRMLTGGRVDFLRRAVSATFVFERVGFVEVK